MAENASLDGQHTDSQMALGAVGIFQASKCRLLPVDMGPVCKKKDKAGVQTASDYLHTESLDECMCDGERNE